MSIGGGSPPPRLLDALAELGWNLETADVGDWAEPMPTAYLVDDEGDELLALDMAPPWVEVLRSTPAPAVLAARLQRRLSDIAVARSQVDPLTGLLNRRSFDEQLRGWLKVRSADGAHAVVMLDLDHFKRVNDRHGHLAGDRMLTDVGALLRQRTTERDLVARLGGDVFVLAMTRTAESVLLQEIDDLLAAHRTLGLDGTPDLALSCSVGSVWAHADDDPRALLQRADAAMYRAKAAGRDTVVIDDSRRPGTVDPEAELRRFMDVTQVYSERLTQMVNALGRRLLQGARREALEDRLTGVANRRYFDERLARECEQAAQHGRALALLFIDLDDFGAINRQHGYACGDAVLQRFVMLATAGIRLTDWLARWGGEEFCVVMPDTAMEVAAEVAERLRQTVSGATLSSPDDQRIRLTCSIGVAAFRPGTDEPPALAERAGAAARRAKASGKNKVVVDGAG